MLNALMDLIAHQKLDGLPIATYWKSDSWRLKYVNGDPKQGRIMWKFFSVSIPKSVVLTDAWHLLKELMISTICILLAINTGIWWTYLLFRVLFHINFNLIYHGKIF